MRYYNVSYTRKLQGSNTRIHVINGRISDRDLQLMIIDTSRFEYVIISAELIDMQVELDKAKQSFDAP
jgi:hypothetical protein